MRALKTTDITRNSDSDLLYVLKILTFFIYLLLKDFFKRMLDSPQLWAHKEEQSFPTFPDKFFVINLVSRSFSLIFLICLNVF